MSNERVVLISGGNRGIGAATARELASNGWNVSIGVRRPDSVPDDLRERCHVQAYDAADRQSEAAWVEAVAGRHSRIDAVVANAGIMIPKTVIEADDSDLDALLDINVKAPLRLARAAWPYLVASGRGRVATVVSLSGKRVKTAQSGLYSVSKFAALALSHAIRQAGWDHGIRSVAICPGFVATDMAFSVTDKAANEMTDPKDIARIVAFALDLPNTASVSEIPINSSLDDSY
ncbi:MAG TPA: SDR family NAD(P)-dependent oxidoreductase [Geminicoccus sp.]|jgi:NADP-dependent 3-hydroxy acid dehydrogenase YdfG|uniref:SDR family NAD(P)-dependent oxidoreductase n=1 Tax=Geminicoccus sp. TaxID=2024832 RepID=UPI002E33FF0A|nr:SDR family NAD(P)-dependent oxidoreductase [Geminicoccus sp.]HEX2526598.1 SDR family NAD(P)-dependent oxidoreductase [Geminicoccus sp.]